MAQSLVKEDSQFLVSDKYTASILFNTKYIDAWLSALEDQDHITEFYIITKQKAIFNNIKEKINSLLGAVIVQESLRLPMSDGFATNTEYFKLCFLDKSSVELGVSFKAIIPMLWLQSGAVGKCPELTDAELPEMFIPEHGAFAVLLQEYAFADFKKVIEGNPKIKYVYIVTNSQITFREIAAQLNVPTVKQLYRDYIDNFTINARRNSI